MAIQSLKRSGVSTFKKYSSALAENSPNFPYPTVTGGTLYSDATYYYRAFRASGSLVVSGGYPANASLTADVMLVGGGGGGGRSYTAAHQGGGGGGAGIVSVWTNAVFATGSFSVVVAAGGAQNTSNGYMLDATASTVTPTSGGGTQGLVGGFGGWSGSVCCPGVVTQAPTSNGGGGGGGSGATVAGAAGAGGTGGSAIYNGSRNGGGGGGAGNGNNGANGSTTTTNTASPGGGGGNGTSAYSSWLQACSAGQNVSGTYWIGGGGGGGMGLYQSGGIYYAGAGAAAGGNGGGGTGLGQASVGATPTGPTTGAANTGGGGGGGGYYATSSTTAQSVGGTVGNGGSGIVIFRYTKASVGG